jgi:dTDP-4-dehydrorhamnose reductase
LITVKPTILLTGKTGQIGWELHRLLLQLGQVFAPDRRELNLSDADSIRRVIRETRPQLIVNAAAYTVVDAAENDESNAYAINAEAPALFAEEAKRLGALLVHYSTDYVFDGSKRSPYNESDETNPLNVYGRTKLVGDQAILESSAAHLIFRTSWVYATRGRNFMLTILRLATEREELRIVHDQTGAPTCAADLAAATAKILTGTLIRTKGVFNFPAASGTYHMTAAGQTTWHEFAKAILEEAGRAPQNLPWLTAATCGRALIASRVLPISTEEFHSRIRRPACSLLSNTRLMQTFGVTLSGWRTQLQRCFYSERIPANPPAVVSSH